MQFHLQFNPKTSQQKMTHEDTLLFIGSCFSEHIGNKLTELKFKTHINPFGIVFNPKSIVISLTKILKKEKFTEQDVFEHNQQWSCFEAHSSCSKLSQQELLDALNNNLLDWHKQLKETKWLCITFGSAYGYRHTNNQIVANCHKLPSNLFTKELLQPGDIVKDCHTLIHELKKINPNLNVMFSVSPVKHLKDGIIENNLSKAILIQSVHEIVKQNKNCFYFPAFELVNDDLRDYRFYKSDMAHPNEQAIDYVFQKFSHVYFNENTTHINTEIRDILNAKKHLPLNIESQSFKDFKHNYFLKCQKLQAKLSWLDLKQELEYFK